MRMCLYMSISLYIRMCLYMNVSVYTIVSIHEHKSVYKNVSDFVTLIQESRPLTKFFSIHFKKTAIFVDLFGEKSLSQ